MRNVWIDSIIKIVNYKLALLHSMGNKIGSKNRIITLIFLFTIFFFIYLQNVNAICFDSWLGITTVASTVGRTFTVSVYVRNIGNVKDSYIVDAVSTTNLKTRINENAIKDVEPNEIGKTEIDVTPIATATNEQIDVTVTSVNPPVSVTSLSFTASSGISVLPDIDIFSILQIMVLALVVLFLSKRLVRIT